MSALPINVRRITLGMIALSGLVGFGAAQQVAEAVELESLRTLEVTMPFETLDPKLAKAAAAAMLQAHLQVLESMRTSRVLTLLALTVASTLSFVVAWRMLRPDGAAREDIRKLLVRSAVACAAFRTMDGAQMTVLAKKIGAASDRVMLASDLPGGYPAGLMAGVFGAASVFLTVVVVGGFLGMSMYFRSNGLRAWVAAADRSGEET